MLRPHHPALVTAATLFLSTFALLLAGLLGCDGISKKPGLLEAIGILPRPALEVRVMSFNIRYGTADDGPNAWPKRRQLLIDTITAASPDVIGLQECLRFQLDELLAAFPKHRAIGVGRDDGRNEGEFSAILYRADRYTPSESGTFWFSDTPDVPGSRSWGNNCTRICTYARLVSRAAADGGRAFFVYNVHLDHESEPSRQKSAAMLAKRILSRTGAAITPHSEGTGDPVILTGDFNMGEDSPAIAFLTGKADSPGTASPESITDWPGLVDTFRVVNPLATEVGTFHDFTGSRSGEKIDFILVTPGTEVAAAAIDYTQQEGRFPSDHFAVTARIRFN